MLRPQPFHQLAKSFATRELEILLPIKKIFLIYSANTIRVKKNHSGQDIEVKIKPAPIP
jgi:hypothetical protein